MTDNVVALLDRLAAEATEDAVSNAVYRQLLEASPNPDIAVPYFTDVVPASTRQGRFGLAELALKLVAKDPGYWPAVEVTIRGAQFTVPEWGALARYGRGLSGQQLLQWFDLVCVDIRIDQVFQQLLADHTDNLLVHRYQQVLDYLLVPDRGPARLNVDSFIEVLRRRGRCRPLEERWREWILAGRFDQPGPGNEDAGILAACLNDRLVDASAAVTPLIDEALRRWQALLNSDDPAERGTGISAMADVIERRVTFHDRLPAAVLHGTHLDPAVRLAIERGFATVRADPNGDRRGSAESGPLHWHLVLTQIAADLH
jgi:hypothetical protein